MRYDTPTNPTAPYGIVIPTHADANPETTPS